MASSGKAVLERRVRQASEPREPHRSALSGLTEMDSKQLGDVAEQFNTVTATAVKTVDDALQAAQQGNMRIEEFNALILAKLDRLYGRRSTR